MKKRLIGIFVCVMLVLTSLTTTHFFSNNTNVKASGGQSGGDYPFDYVWAQAYNFSKVIREANYTQDNNIPRGREWATGGERYTIDQILKPNMYGLNNPLGLTGYQEIPIGRLNKLLYRTIGYSNKVVLDGFNLTINHNTNCTYPYSKTMPTSEVFACPTGYKNWENNVLDDEINWTMNNVTVIQKNITDWWPYVETGNDDCKNVTCNAANNITLLSGNVTYLSANDPVPDDQDGEVFMFNDTPGCQTKINQMDESAGLILITAGDDIQYADVSGCFFPVATIQSDAANLSQILTSLQSGTWMSVDDLNDTCLTFFNITGLPSWWPDHDFMIIDRMPTAAVLYNITSYYRRPLKKVNPTYNSDYTIEAYCRTEYLDIVRLDFF
jgi:hypothetical protein